MCFNLHSNSFTFFDKRVYIVREMQINSHPSAIIVARLRQGDRDVLVELYKENEAMVNKYIKDQKGREEDAEDLLQEALIVLWKNAKKPEFTLDAKPSTYIYAVVKNLWLKQVDKNKRMSPEENINPQMHSTVQNSDSNLDHAIVRKMLNQMGETCRQVLLMFYFDGFDMQTIAKANNFANADVAKSKKHQCMKDLESKVKSQFSSTDFFR